MAAICTYCNINSVIKIRDYARGQSIIVLAAQINKEISMNDTDFVKIISDGCDLRINGDFFYNDIYYTTTTTADYNRITYPSICKHCGAPMHSHICEYCGIEYN